MAKRKGDGLDRDVTVGLLTSIRDELKTLRGDLGGGLEAVRAETAQGLQAVRAETAQGLQAVRAEMTQELRAVRVEVAQEIRGLRSDMAEGFGELMSRLDTLTETTVADHARRIARLEDAAFAK